MSGKGLIFLVLVAVAGYTLTRATPPVPAGARAEGSATAGPAGIGARFEYGLGALGSKILGNTVRSMVAETEQALGDMAPSIKAARKGDVRPRKFAREVVVMDSLALENLRMGKPIEAMRSAMNAKSVLNSVRGVLQRSL